LWYVAIQGKARRARPIQLRGWGDVVVGFGVWDLRVTYVTLGQLGIGLREAGLDRIAEQCLVAPSVHPHVVGKLLIPRFDILHVDLDGALRTVGYLLLPRTN